MSAVAEEGAQEPKAGRTMVFRKRRFAPAQSADQSRRQAELVQRAWSHFGEAAPMIAFLNARHDELEAAPLTIALESDEGFARVERLLEQLPRKA